MRILLVEDHAVVREGVRRLLGAQPDVGCIIEAATAQEALVLHRREAPDLVLLDLNLPGLGGFELLRRLLLQDGSARIVVFSMHADPAYAARALRTGARGYVSKGAPVDELVTAVRKVAGGGRYVDRELAAGLAAAPVADDPLRQLTVREVEILRMLGGGKSLAEIAHALGVAYKTVANTCSQMKVKLGVDRTADLIRLSVEIGSI